MMQDKSEHIEDIKRSEHSPKNKFRDFSVQRGALLEFIRRKK